MNNTDVVVVDQKMLAATDIIRKAITEKGVDAWVQM